MEHHTTHGRILASPEPPTPSSSMDPTLNKKKKNHHHHHLNPKPTSTTKNPDPIVPSRSFSMSKHLSRLYPTQKTQKPSQPCKDIHLQAKAMTLSADFDSSKFSLTKKIHQNPILDKKFLSTSKEVVEKKKVKEQVVVDEMKKKKKMMMMIEGHGPLFCKRMSSSVGGRRRSFCGSQLELADFLASNGAKIVSVDMPPFMQIHAVDCARKTSDSLEKFTSKTLALTLKKEFDVVYGPAWHCIVGTSFGSFVTHSVGGFLYFSLDQKLYILLFKTTVQRAD